MSITNADSFLFYSDARFMEVEKYLEKFWPLYQWERQHSRGKLGSIEVETSMSESQFVQFQFTGPLAFRLKENLLAYLEINSSLESYFLGLTDLAEPLLREYQNRESSYLADEAQEPLDSIHAHLSLRG